jgi:hypothetical protein
LRIAMSLPGAITYVTADQVNEKVRVLTIDGRKPGSTKYLLNE